MYRHRKQPILLLVILLAALVTSNVRADSPNEARSTELTIERIVSVKGPFSEDLYPHIRSLAKIQLERNELDSAIENYRRMQNLVHRHDGVYSPLQFESIDSLIRSHTAKGEFDQVDNLQEFRFSVAQYNYPPNSAEMVEPLLKMASWYQHTRQYDRSLSLFEQSRELIQNNNLPRSTLIRVLRSEALTLYLAGICCADERLKLVDSLLAEDPNSMLLSSMELSDMMFLLNKDREAIKFSNNVIRNRKITKVNWQPRFLGFNRQGDIVESYKRTLVLRSQVEPRMQIWFNQPADDSGQAHLQQSVVIGSPVPVCRQGANNLLGVSAKRLGDYFVDVDLKVDSTGDVFDIKIDGNAPHRLQMYLRNILQEAKYRPGIENNQIADETSLSFKQTFKPTNVNRNSPWGLILNFQACTLLPTQNA